MYGSIDFEDSLRFLPSKYKNNIIEKAQKMTIGKSDDQLFEMSRQHLLNALTYRAPRLYDSSSHVSYFYLFQTSRFWQNSLLIISYLFMYLVFVSFQKPGERQNWIEWGFLIVFWFDVLLEVYHKYYETLRESSRFQTRFFLKIGLLTLLTLDQLIVLVQIHQNSTGFRPFLVLRCCLPVLYHPSLRKNVEAMQDLYQDIFVYIFFYAMVILIFAMFLSQIIVLETDEPIDQYTENYGDLGKDLFLMYCLSSYEGYPDNQIRSIEQDSKIQIFYIIFILLNMFFFVTIPTSLLFKTFKESRSRILLIDEIKQQNSLILAFICLCKNEPEVHRDRLIKFLLYVFKNKPGYTDFIMKVVLQLDENGNGKIEVSEFMQICKIMQAHGRVDPPLFKDLQCWIRFRSFINERFNLKETVLSTKFNIYVCFIIFISIINATLYLYTKNLFFRIIDDLISYLYVIELILKFVGIGPENYFKDPWNRRDFIIVLTIIILEVFSYLHLPWLKSFNKKNFDVLAKFLRAYKLAVACKYLSDRSQYVSKSEFYIKASRLVTQIIMTIPIVIEFFPLYLILFYFFGVLGIQVFTNIKPEVAENESPYNNYQQVANFNSFLYSQFFMIQTLVEGGWSVVGYDHAYRFGIPFTITMMMFVFCHFSITLVLSSLVKGVIWEIYEQVDLELDRKVHENERIIKNEKEIKIKKEKLTQIKNKINLNEPLTLENLISREIFENKVDTEIAKKINNALTNPENDYMRKRDLRKRTHCIPTLVKDLNLINVDEIDVMLGEEDDQDMAELLLKKIISELSIDDIKEEDLKDSDIEDEMERLISIAIIDRKESYTETIVYPSILVEFLTRKLIGIEQYNHQIERRSRNSYIFKRAMSYESKSDIYESEFDLYSEDFQKNEESLSFLTSTLKSLLEVKTSSRDRKAKIISNLVADGVISEEEGAYSLQKKSEKNVSLHPEWILRKTFLTNTSEKLVKKLEIDFFSSVYGDEIKEVNNVTVQPLLRLESKLTFSLTNILRYKQIGDHEFWTALCEIENSISTKLLKRGSLFKFVFQIDSLNESWFTVKVKENGEIKPHFIKNGIWIHNPNMKSDQMFIGKDMFYWRELQEGDNLNQTKNAMGFSRQGEERRSNQEFRAKFIKMLYQSFESIAFCLKSDEQFWDSNPSELIYDFFSIFKNVENTPRQVEKRFSISKIMFFILSNEGERIFNSNKTPLNYELTDIKITTENINKSNISTSSIRPSLADKIKYKLDDSKEEISERIKKVENMDDQQIEETEGLPHSFIVNLLTEIFDIVKLHEENFVYRIERISNRDYLNKENGRVSWRRSAILGDLNISRRISEYII